MQRASVGGEDGWDGEQGDGHGAPCAGPEQAPSVLYAMRMMRAALEDELTRVSEAVLRTEWGPLMIRSRRFGLIALTLLLVGCAARSFTHELDAGVGRWTKDEVIARLGSPTQVTQLEDEEVWVYTEIMPAPTRSLTFGWLTIGSPHQADPLGLPGGGTAVPVQESPRSAGESPSTTLRREYLLFFSSEGILIRWQPR